jgi:nicotinate phosphoribosyltransferase
MIVKSILDTDLYKFSMAYFYMKEFPYAEGIFEFKDRNNEVYGPEFLEMLKMELVSLSNLKLTDNEKSWCIKNIPYIPEHFWEWIQNLGYDISKIYPSLDNEGHLRLITDIDTLKKVTLWEVPVLSIISEVRAKYRGYTYDHEDYMRKLDQKILLSNQNQLKFSEFGTRRRFSAALQEDVVKRCKEKAQYFVGTSNVYLAMKYGLKPIGTLAHELCMFIASQYGYKHPNYILMEKWAGVYKGDLGIYLTDTFKTDTFLRDFTKAQAKLWDGVRHDSGDPYQYISKIIKKYKELGIDPKTKTIVFSNALEMTDFSDIAEACKGRIQCSAGIGTSLVSTDTGNPPANIVMKLSKARLNPSMELEDCIKISDDEGKLTGSIEEYNLARQILKV